MLLAYADSLDVKVTHARMAAPMNVAVDLFALLVISAQKQVVVSVV
jgi:hypothetical protein